MILNKLKGEVITRKEIKVRNKLAEPRKDDNEEK